MAETVWFFELQRPVTVSERIPNTGRRSLGCMMHFVIVMKQVVIGEYQCNPDMLL